jgi:hypothetical protein
MRKNGHVSIKMWGQSRQGLAELAAKAILRDHKEYTLSDALESEAKRVLTLLERGYQLPVVVSVGRNRNLVTQPISEECYRGLLQIQAYLMIQEGHSVSLSRVVNSVVENGLKDEN